MTEIERRTDAFARMGARFSHTAIAPLMLAHLIEPSLFWDLEDAVRAYLRAAAPASGHSVMGDYDRGLVYAVTPAGMVVPKATSALEFNAVVKSFAAIIASLNIADLIAAWAMPPNVRFKASHHGENVTRPHATEKPHTDVWAGESSESVTIHIPILGDTRRNCMALYHPRNGIDPAWLTPRKDYQEGAEILAHYERLDYVIPTGSIALLDCATIHASTLLPGAGYRVSLDARFVLEKRDMAEHLGRDNEYFPHSLLAGIGLTHYLHFPDAPQARAEVGAFQHPARMRVIQLDHNIAHGR